MLALALTASLYGCSEGDRYVSHDEATDIANDAVNASGLEARIDDLEARLSDVEGETKSVRSLAVSTASQTAHNATVANENAVRDMTRRGACGYKTLDPPRQNADGSVTLSERIPCTKADLAP